ncbi:hypothetical protein FGO68_gene10732 [Halteria grandinella]|uniref:Uncharacterized protein n=1 Tax=Halteria grandinella TaxID=5974 RepID=A0A8J8T8M8_HALGN|nr:hypothetical protein FGO68_gene10732 [Halteria grandinella]
MWKISGKYCLINLLSNLEFSQAAQLLFRVSKWSRKQLISGYPIIKRICKDNKLLKDYTLHLNYFLDYPKDIYISDKDLARLIIDSETYKNAQNFIVNVSIDENLNNQVIFPTHHLKRALKLSTQLNINSIYQFFLNIEDALMELLQNPRHLSFNFSQHRHYFNLKPHPFVIKRPIKILTLGSDTIIHLSKDIIKQIPNIIIRAKRNLNKIVIQESDYPETQFTIVFLDPIKRIVTPILEYYKSLLQQKNIKIELQPTWDHIKSQDLTCLIRKLVNDHPKIAIAINHIDPTPCKSKIGDSNYGRYLNELQIRKKEIGDKFVIERTQLKSDVYDMGQIPTISEEVVKIECLFNEEIKLGALYCLNFEKVKQAKLDLTNCKVLARQQSLVLPPMQLSINGPDQRIMSLLKCYKSHKNLKILKILIPIQTKTQDLNEIYSKISTFPALQQLTLPYTSESMPSLMQLLTSLSSTLQVIKLHQIESEFSSDSNELISTVVKHMSNLKLFKLRITDKAFALHTIKGLADRVTQLSVIVQMGDQRILVSDANTVVEGDVKQKWLGAYQSRSQSREKQVVDRGCQTEVLSREEQIKRCIAQLQELTGN